MINPKRQQRTVKTSCTFNFGLEMWVLIEDFQLLLPVKAFLPVRHHFPELFGVKAVVKPAALKRLGVTGFINTAE